MWADRGGSVDAPSDWRPGGRGFNPRRDRQHSFVEIDHEIFSTVILGRKTSTQTNIENVLNFSIPLSHISM